TPVQDHVDRVVRPEDVLADVAGLVGLVQRLRDPLLGEGHLAPDVEEGLGGADRVRRDEHALDELVRVPLHEEAVLVGAGLRLVAVDDEVPRPHAGRAEAPLHAGGEAGAAPAEQAGRLDLLLHLVGGLAERGLQALVAAGGDVALERVPVVEAEAAGDDRAGVGDGHQASPPSLAAARVIQTGSSHWPGIALPARRSAGMCWRTRASVPCSGTSWARRPARRSSRS